MLHAPYANIVGKELLWVSSECWDTNNTPFFSQPSDRGIKDSTGLFESSSTMFVMATASLLAVLGVTFIAGLSYHLLIFLRQRKKGVYFWRSVV